MLPHIFVSSMFGSIDDNCFEDVATAVVLLLIDENNGLFRFRMVSSNGGPKLRPI
jgi:hypothetical protein